MDKKSVRGKQRARRLLVQALYQWQLSGHELCEIQVQFHVANNMEKVDVVYFNHILHDIPKHLSALEDSLAPFLDRPINQLNPVELAVLRLGAYELLHCPEVPYRVVLDESVSLTREFGSQDGYRYVNGVLNTMARSVRAIEISHEHG